MANIERNEPLVSVIIVAHDDAAAIRRSIESVQNQTYRTHEVIVVDDGSHDGTRGIIESMAERDLTITPLHTRDAGKLAAMDLAISRATGKYLLFFGPESWADGDLLSDLVGLAEQHRLELAIAGFSTFIGSRGQHVKERVINHPRCVYQTQNDFRTSAWQLFEECLFSTLGAKLFLRERVEKLRLRLDCDAGSTAFLVGYLRDVERVGVTGQVHYRMVNNKDEENATFSIKDYEKLESQYESLLGLYHAWGLDGDPASMSMLQSRYFNSLVACITKLCADRSGLSNAEKRRMVEEMVNSDRAKLAANVARPRDVGSKALLASIKSGNTNLTFLEGIIASMMRRDTSEQSSFCVSF